MYIYTYIFVVHPVAREQTRNILARENVCDDLVCGECVPRGLNFPRARETPVSSLRLYLTRSGRWIRSRRTNSSALRRPGFFVARRLWDPSSARGGEFRSARDIGESLEQNGRIPGYLGTLGLRNFAIRDCSLSTKFERRCFEWTPDEGERWGNWDLSKARKRV